MVSDSGHKGPIEPGTYIIRSVQSSKPLDLVRNDSSVTPSVCIWHAIASPTQKWSVELGTSGYLIRNTATAQYISFEPETPASGTRLIGATRPVEWQIEDINQTYRVTLVSSEFVLDVVGEHVANGTRIMLFGWHGGPNQLWTFQRIDEEQPPSYTRQLYVGPVPAGVYWLGQPNEASKSADGKPITMNKAPSSAALSAAARLPLGDEEKAYAHLSAIGNGPWPHQIWVLEPGRHGYRLKNLGVGAYLNYVNTEPVLESATTVPSSVTEWALWRHPVRDLTDVLDYYIRPSFDLNIVLGVSKGDNFNQLRARTFAAWEEERKKGNIYHQWRLETVDWNIFQASLAFAP